MIEEKRAYTRKNVSLLTNIFDSKTKNILGECFLTDVSQNGFAIESETNLLIGQNLNLKLTILNREVLLNGEIVRIADGFFYQLYGVKIIDCGCENLDFFKKYVDYSLN